MPRVSVTTGYSPSAFRSTKKARYYAGQKASRFAYAQAKRMSSVASSGEFKSRDAGTSGAANTTGSVTAVNGLAVGTAINERVGREVLLKSVQYNYTFTVTAGTGVDQIQRVLLVYDRQANGSAPAITDVLVSATVHSPRNLDNRRRFKILMDRTVALNASGEPGSKVTERFYRKLRHPTTFNSGTAGTVADIATGSLLLITLGSEAPGVTAGTVEGYIRTRYTDK